PAGAFLPAPVAISAVELYKTGDEFTEPSSSPRHHGRFSKPEVALEIHAAAGDELEKRLTEFQVIVTADGQIAGAIGIQIIRQHALLHSEGYTDFSVAD